MNMQSILSAGEVLHKYDVFFIDLWGVMHDGSALYEGAGDAVAHLHEAGKQILFLSNAPRKATKAIAVLDRLGIPADHYQHMLTSGQAAHDMLRDADDWGTHYYYLGPSKDEDVLEGLDYIQTSSPQEANFILNAGFEEDYQPTDEILPTLQTLLEQDLPLLCINPDMEVVKQDGSRLLCAGWVAEHYEQMGGSVRYIGKPHGEIYRRAAACFDGIDTSRTLAIGDNLLTDIKGANRFGIDSLLITGGILTSEHGHLPNSDTIAQLCKDTQATPTYITERFAI